MIPKWCTDKIPTMPMERREPETYPSLEYIRVPFSPKRILVDGDNHYPIHDKAMEAAVIAFARDIKPDIWVSIGDRWDTYAPSRFPKEASRIFAHGYTLEDEFISSAPANRELCKIVKRADILLGNHERRLERIIDANPWMIGSINWASMAHLPNNCKVHSWGRRIQYNVGGCQIPLRFEHGDAISASAKHKADWLMNKGPANVIFGHWHSVSSCLTTRHEVDGLHQYGCWSQGHASDVDKAAYVRHTDPNWQQGFTLVDVWKDGESFRFSVTPIVVIKGQFTYNGKTYNGHKWI